MEPDSGGVRRQASFVNPATARPPLAVLFVDPDARRAEQLAASLRASCAVTIVTSAQAAAAAMFQQAPDLIVTGLELPDTAGTDFIAKVHGTPATRHVLLMVLTKRGSLRDKIAALTAGADDYVIWPISPEAFALRVQLLGRFRRTLIR